MRTSLAAAGFAALVTVTDAAQSGKAIQPPFNRVESTQIGDLNNDLPSHEYLPTRWEPWIAGWVPQACFDAANNNKLSASDFEVRNVHYTDCDAAWTICRHKNSPASWATIMTFVGRVPVGMRQYVANVVVLPDTQAGFAAYTTGYYTVFSPSYANIGVAAHEFTHILDVYEAGLASAVQNAGYPLGTPWSKTQMWADAYNDDTGVPTDYAAAAGFVEDFADTGRWALSEMVQEGRLATYSAGWAGCSNQIGAYRSRLQDVLFPSGGRCTAKRDTTQAVSATAGTRARGLVRRRMSNLAGTGVPPILTPEGVEDNIRFPPHPVPKNSTS